MIELYLFSLLPALIGGILFLRGGVVCWKGWLGSSGISFVVAGGIHLFSFISQTKDFEVWSGYVITSRQYSSWTEQYQEAVYKTVTRTNSDGSTYITTEFSHWETRTRFHPESFKIGTSIGTVHSITKKRHEYFVTTFGNCKKIKGKRSTFEMGSRMISGDPFDHISTFTTIEPIHIQKYVTNRIKASQNVFSVSDVPEEFNKLLFEYPLSSNIFESNRLLGEARGFISKRDWDIVNAKLGQSKGVNLILIGFDSEESLLGQYQRSKWGGGKKNDLVICYGKGWSFVFGWSDAELCKRKIEFLIDKNGMSVDTLTQIEKIVQEHYTKTNWEKFDHISVQPKLIHWTIFLLTSTLSQITFYILYNKNK